MHLPHPVAAAARTRPDHVVLASAGEAFTARELADHVSRAAGALVAAGVRPGDRVALRGPANADFVVALHAIGWLGAAAAPLPPKATPAELAAAIAAVAPSAWAGDVPGGLPLDLRGDPLPERDSPLDEVRLVALTSGTTGAPRAVPLTVGRLVFGAMGSALRLGHLPSDRWVCCLPLHHVGGLAVLLRCAWYGTTAELHPSFDPDRVNASIDAGAALVSLVPTMLARLLDAREGAFPASLRAVLVGGAATPEPLIERCRERGVPLALTWGMTEAGSQVATRFPGDLSPTGGVGPPLAFSRVRVDGGLLVVDDPAGTLRTADRGRVDDAGNVHVWGRADDVLVSGGENVDPAEVEAVLRAHPGVRDAAVAGAPDPTWGERPVAWVVTELPDEALKSWCRERLSGFKVPERYVRVAEIPRNPLGKVVRSALR